MHPNIKLYPANVFILNYITYFSAFSLILLEFFVSCMSKSSKLFSQKEVHIFNFVNKITQGLQSPWHPLMDMTPNSRISNLADAPKYHKPLSMFAI